MLRPALPWLLILIALVTVLALSSPAWLACFFGGFAAGGVTRHVAMVIQSRRVLPLMLDVIDWPKVDRLLDGVETSDPRDAPAANEIPD
ncbi:hypothetical protein [Paludisphaera soli]|uniref:hypothetical protein n=1 Tax=Paludisphaera soli TaxID=2712865 RepID=UPI0013EE30BF|nr:hypothetical protein [Paludisphaera soli]